MFYKSDLLFFLVKLSLKCRLMKHYKNRSINYWYHPRFSSLKKFLDRQISDQEIIVVFTTACILLQLLHSLPDKFGCLVLSIRFSVPCAKGRFQGLRRVPWHRHGSEWKLQRFERRSLLHNSLKNASLCILILTQNTEIP